MMVREREWSARALAKTKRKKNSASECTCEVSASFPDSFHRVLNTTCLTDSSNEKRS